MISFKNTGFNKLINLDSLIRNGIVVVICLLGMGGSLWFVRHDLNSSLQDPGKKPVGTVYWVINNAKRLSSDRIQWDRLEQHSLIYDGDIVSSDVFSEVKINFEDGEELELSPNTSVRIVYQNSNKIRFVPQKGEIQIQSGREALAVSLAEIIPANTVISDTGISLNPETFAGIKIPETNTLNGFTLKVYKGSGTYLSNGVSRTIEAGEAIRVGNDGLVQTNLPVTMLLPRTGTRLFKTSQEKVPVEFQWKQLNSSEGTITLELSQTKDFSALNGNWYMRLENADPTDRSAVIMLSEGMYYWKIYESSLENETSSQDEADSGWLDIIYTEGTQALSPADGTVVTFSPGEQEVHFFWAVPEESEAVVLEVADNPEMVNPRIRQVVKEDARGARGSYDSSVLEAGQWYWRVTPVVAGITDHPSPVNSFTLKESVEQPIQKIVNAPVRKVDDIPSLIFPPDDYSLEANRTPDLLFTWSNTISDNARFQVSTLSDFTGTLIMDAEVSGFNMQSPFLAPGIYYWRIAGVDPEPTAGAAGIVPETRNSPPENASHPNRLVIMSALPSPLLDTPTENERLIIQEGVPAKFSWSQVKYANYYEFKLFLEGREIPLRGISSLKNNSIYVYFDPNTQGQFTWTIQGFTSPTGTTTGRAGLIARGRFYITPDIPLTGLNQISWTIPRIANMQSYAGEVDSPITLISPSLGINIPGTQALRSPPEAHWVSDVPLKNIQLIVSRTTDPSSDPRSIVRNASGTSVTFPSLSEGIWYWIIRGDTSELRGATPGDPFWFNVLPVPLLPTPRPIQPQNKAVIGLEQLTRDRNITFRWNSVDGANAYIFSLYQDDAMPKLLFTTSPQTALFYVFENLSLLNNGNYFWQVEAVVRNKNGAIEQRGGTAQYPFTIEIQHSTNLRTIQQGTLYGQ